MVLSYNTSSRVDLNHLAEVYHKRQIDKSRLRAESVNIIYHCRLGTTIKNYYVDSLYSYNALFIRCSVTMKRVNFIKKIRQRRRKMTLKISY